MAPKFQLVGRMQSSDDVETVESFEYGTNQKRRCHRTTFGWRVRFRVCVQVYKCLHNMAPGYLSALCQPVSGVPGRRHLYAQLVVVNWTSPVSICPRTGDGRLPTPVLHPGTRCLTISRTLIFPFNLSNAILRHSSFPHTSTFQRV